MTTTTEKLEALAQLYEQKAASLRLAVEELNGHATTKKAPKINGMLTAAAALRESQRPERPQASGWTQSTPQDIERRMAIIRAYLRAHPWVGSREIAEELQRQGEDMNQDRVQKLLSSRMRDTLERRGERAMRRYRLKAGRTPPSKTPKAHPRASRVANGEKTAIIVGLVRDHSPITIKELVPLARAAGILSLTGMYNYVTQGYLRKTKKGKHRAYAFVTMPPSSSASSSAAAAAQ